MTVKLETTIKRFIGLSTDTKPQLGLNLDGLTLTALDLPPGSSFLETDTGRIWRYNSLEWVVHVPEDEQAELLSALLVEVARIGKLLTIVTGVELEENIGIG